MLVKKLPSFPEKAIAISQKIAEWNLKEPQGMRKDEVAVLGIFQAEDMPFENSPVGHRSLIEVNGEVEGGSKGARFVKGRRSALYLNYDPEINNPDGMAMAIAFTLEGEPNSRGETLVKSWLFPNENRKFFSDQEYENGVSFCLQLTGRRHVRVILAGNKGWEQRFDISLSSDEFTLVPGIRYFVFFQYDYEREAVTIAIAKPGEELLFVKRAFDQPLSDKMRPVIVGAQEIDRERPDDPEPIQGCIDRLGFYRVPLSDDEVTSLAWEYGVYPYLNNNALTGEQVLVGNNSVFCFPAVNSFHPLLETEVAIVQAAYGSVIQFFLNQLDTEGLKLFRYDRQLPGNGVEEESLEQPSWVETVPATLQAIKFQYNYATLDSRRFWLTEINGELRVTSRPDETSQEEWQVLILALFAVEVGGTLDYSGRGLYAIARSLDDLTLLRDSIPHEVFVPSPLPVEAPPEEEEPEMPEMPAAGEGELLVGGSIVELPGELPSATPEEAETPI